MKAETSKTKGVAKAPSAAVKTGAAKAPAKVSEPVAPAVSQPAAAQMPLRSTRPSSRLAQLTVPSMAQSVASTAAKASYTNTMPSTMQVSPPMASTKKDAKLANNWKTKPLEELTDAEVLAMPDSEYMNDTQMAFFRRKLVLLKQDMHNNAGETTEHLREDTVVVPDPADRGRLARTVAVAAPDPRGTERLGDVLRYRLMPQENGVQLVRQQRRPVQDVGDLSQAVFEEEIRLHAQRSGDHRDHRVGGHRSRALGEVIEIPGGQLGLVRQLAVTEPAFVHQTLKGHGEPVLREPVPRDRRGVHGSHASCIAR